ncbi:MAG: hypothetical protein IT304_01930 [Dehalococcoidia bacterium]|nr:hypothetical protein [Dehalococcoidia bacterium]
MRRPGQERCDECGEPATDLVKCAACGCLVCCADENGLGFACRIESEEGVLPPLPPPRPPTRG